MSFRFRMYLEDGEDIGDYTASVPNWLPGDTVYVEGWPKYRIRSVIPMNDLDKRRLSRHL
jgi:hypothetical protein